MSTQELTTTSGDLQEIMTLGKVFTASGYFRDIRDQSQAVTKILYGRELGFSPIVAITGIHIVEGKPTLSSNLMATLIKRSGRYDYRLAVWTDKLCTLRFMQRVDGKWDDVGQSTFTIEDAQRAGVVRPNSGWTKFPKAMLFARALSQGLRAYCPDVSSSPLYAPEEMGAEVNEEGEVTKLPKSALSVETIEKEIIIEANEATTPSTAGNGSAESAETQAAPEPDPFTVYIDEPIQQNFARCFKDALPGRLKKDADKYRHDWLTIKSFIDENGNPTSARIPKALYYELRDEAEQWAAQL